MVDVTLTRPVSHARSMCTGISKLLLPLLNQQEVGRIVEIIDNHKLFCSRTVEIDAFLASFDKSKGITSCRRQFPEGYVFRSRA